jgi:mycothiol synthase
MTNGSSEFHYRPVSLDDVDVLTAMLDATTRTHVDRRTTEQETLQRLGTPGCNLATDSILVTTPVGEVLAFGHVWADPPAQVRAFARVRPDARGRGIGTRLAQLIIERASQIAAGMPRHPVQFSTTSWAKDTTAAAVLRHSGLHETRHFLRMVRDLETDLPALHWPTGVSARRYRPGRDDAALFAAYCDAFAAHWGAEQPHPVRWWWDERDAPDSGFDPALWTVAEADGEIAGFVLGRVREREGRPEGYISQLGVRPGWRGHGLGNALLAHQFDTFTGRGLTRAALDVDVDNVTAALRVYRSAGMIPVPNFTVWGRIM